MAVPILFELNQELIRLFIAGSRLSIGDPRLKKFIAPLKKYGEKVPVFLKLAENIEELLEVDANQSAGKLIETETFLLSVLSTQGDTSVASDETVAYIKYAQSDEAISETLFGYRTLSPVIEALTSTGSGRMEVVSAAFEKGVFKDSRLYKIAVDALGDKYSEIADYIANTVLPSIGDRIYPFLLDGYNVRGVAIDERRLTVMHKIKGENMLGLVDEAIEKGNAAIRANAVKIMAKYPKYENLLLDMLGENKTVREEVMKALIEIDSKTGIDKIMEIYKSNKRTTVIDAISSSYGTTSQYLADELLKVTFEEYDEVKNFIDNFSDSDISEMKDEDIIKKIKKLKDSMSALRNKHTDDTIQFFKTALSEEYLSKAEIILPIEKMYYYRSFVDIAIEAIYNSGKGNDFLWEMFINAQRGLSNTKKNKNIPRILYRNAFYIGAKKLSADEFYDTFFKTHLYKEISQEDYYAFQNVFLIDENSPAFSKKIAHYFFEKMDGYHISLAAQIVSSDDYDLLNSFAEKLKKNLKTRTYSYSNYEILKRLGEAKHKDFKNLYELYCLNNHGSLSERQHLEQLLIL